MNRVMTLGVAMVASGLLLGCGGGDKKASTPAASTVIEGVASKGPLNQAKVTAYRVEANGQRGARITETETSADGQYSLPLGSYSGPVEIEVTVIAGKTTSADEATGNSISLPVDFVLRSTTVVSPPTTASTRKEAHVTPFTELARELAGSKAGGLTSANIQAAIALVSKTYGFDPVVTRPIRFDAAPPADATEDQKRYAMFNAAVSQMAKAGTACQGEADAGARVKCAVGELRGTLTVATASAGEAKVQLKDTRVDALAQAMQAIAASNSNKTGITAGHKVVQDLRQAAEEAKTRSVEISVSTSQSGDDISTKARKFFNNLRANAAALEAGAAEQALTTPLKEFGDMVDGDAAAVTTQVGRTILMADTARKLWSGYLTGGPSSIGHGGFPGGCSVHSGAFPPALLANWLTAPVDATSPEDAAWVGCRQGSNPSMNAGDLTTQIMIFFDMRNSRDLSRPLPYLAGSRIATRTVQGGLSYSWKSGDSLLAGSAGYVIQDGELRGFSISGDLPPAFGSARNPLAARYAVNLDAGYSVRSNGLVDIRFTNGSLGVVPVGASAARTTIDISPAGATSAVLWDDPGGTAQVDASRIEAVARISNAKGQINGKLVIDLFENQSTQTGQDDMVGRITFSGDLSLTGKGKILEGILVFQTPDTDTTVVNFNGELSLPSRPVVRLKDVSVEGFDNVVTKYSGEYEQNGVTVRFNGTGGAAGRSVTFQGVEASVEMTATAGQNLIEVNVGGTKAATIDQDKARISYVDGSFESL